MHGLRDVGLHGESQPVQRRLPAKSGISGLLRTYPPETSCTSGKRECAARDHQPTRAAYHLHVKNLLTHADAIAVAVYALEHGNGSCLAGVCDARMRGNKLLLDVG